jgi:hypothetical protein
MLCQALLVAVDGFFKTEVEGIAHKGVADAYFVEPGDVLVDESEVL